MTSLTPGADVPHLGNGISRPGGSRGLNRSRGRAYRTHSGREYGRCANGGCDEMAAIEGISVQIVRHRVPVMLRPRSAPTELPARASASRGVPWPARERGLSAVPRRHGVRSPASAHPTTTMTPVIMATPMPVAMGSDDGTRGGSHCRAASTSNGTTDDSTA